MEEYAFNRLKKAFDTFSPQDHESNENLAHDIVREIKKRHPYYEDFKNCFWKVISNLVLNRPACEKNMSDLVHGTRWNTVNEFLDATHDDLDPSKSTERKEVRQAFFRKFNTAKTIEQKSIDTENDYSETLGLKCPKCFSDNTEYLLLQTSRGDEGSTARSLCNVCGHRWKFR